MDFEIVGDIQHIETMAVGSHIRDLTYLQKVYGHGRWRKLKGIAFVKLSKKNLLHNAAAISLIIAGSSLQLYSSDKETR